MDLQTALSENRDLVDPLGRQAVEALAHCRTPLAAEVTLSELLGLVELAVPDSDRATIGGAQDQLLTELVTWAEDQASIDSLSLLRVIQVLGAPPVRAAASTAAARLSATGVVDRPWAARIGRPQILRAWRYGDVDGSQESVSIQFAYTSRDHVLAILIDHQLSGGVKDCWVAEGRAAGRLRDDTAAQIASNPFAEFEDLPVDTTLRILSAAMAQAPCPEQDDQIEDVARFLPLTRARLEWMTADR